MSRARNASIFSLLLAALSAPVFAYGFEAEGVPDRLSLQGEAFSDLRFPVNDATSGLQQASASLWLQGRQELGPSWTAKFHLAGDGFATQPLGGSRAKLQLREGFFQYSQGGWEVRAGQQILVWGNSDGHSPTDYLTASDFTFFNPEEERRRIGSPSLQLAFTPANGNSPWSYKLVWSPIFPESRLLIPSGILGAGVAAGVAAGVTAGVNDAGLSSLRFGLSSSEFALKSSYLGEGWDFSFSAFSGWNHIPYFSVASVSATGIVLEERFQKLLALGAESSFSRGAWIFRAETAYKSQGHEDSAAPSGYFDTVLGTERPLGQRFRMQAQLLTKYFPAWRDPSSVTGEGVLDTAARQGAARANAILLDQQERLPTSVSFRLAYQTESDDFDCEVYLLGSLTGGGYLLRPSATYRFLPGTSFQLGLDGYGGPADRLLGAAAPFRAVFAEFKKIF